MILGIFNDKVPTELGDRLQLSMPIAVGSRIMAKVFHRMARAQPERWEALEKAGFKVDPFGDLAHVLNVRRGGHYVDIGTSAKIANGLIKMKSDASPVSYTKKGLLFSDGTEIKADVIVFTTGFALDARDEVAAMLGAEVAAKSEKYYGLNEEGEVNGAFKPSGRKY